jgi:lipopolysaccharide/colanic/teichoic acid biosynthesis glycosyltransferase
MKRIFDIALALIGMAAVSPLMLILAVVIRLTSDGPILYQGVRVGRKGVPFRILKFRSMIADAEKCGGSSTANGDPRITPIGRFMRKYKLDELPQLVNVLMGEMSFVGPRPEVQEYVDLYTDREKPILTVRPGITDWATIWNSDEGAVLANATDPDQAYLEWIRPTKLQLQLLYVSHHSLWIDLKIIIYTFRKVLSKDWVPKELQAYDDPRSVSKRSVLTSAAA